MERDSDAELSQRSLDARVARLAAAQYGVFARERVARLGATRDVIRRRVGASRWEPLTRDAFRVAGSTPSWRQSLMVARLAWGRGTAVSHVAAAGLWRLAGFEPGPVALTVPRARRRRGPGTVYRNRLAPSDVTTVDGIPVTTAARTLLDLAAVAPREAVEEALDDALRRGLVSMARLRWDLARWGRSRLPGVGVLRALVEAREPAASVPQSVLETRLLRAMKRAGLPAPVRQHPVRDGGKVVAVLDFAYPDVRLGIEADGYRWHSGRAKWERDRARLNRLTLLGWRIAHVTSRDLESRPDGVAESIRSALGDDGEGREREHPRRSGRPPY